MRITATQLRRIIREEVRRVSESASRAKPEIVSWLEGERDSVGSSDSSVGEERGYQNLIDHVESLSDGGTDEELRDAACLWIWDELDRLDGDRGIDPDDDDLWGEEQALKASLFHINPDYVHPSGGTR